MFSNQELSEIKKLLQPDKEIVIVTHYNPDGDAIGSSLGLKHALKNLGIDATVVQKPSRLWCQNSKEKKLQRYFIMPT